MSEVAGLPVDELERLRPPRTRHLFRSVGPPQPGSRALCGAVYHGGQVRRDPPVTRETCVVCLDLARGLGLGL